MGRQRASFREKAREKTIRHSDRKLKVFSRKETRSGSESDKARKESQGNAIFPVETDEWLDVRERTKEWTNEVADGWTGQTDRKASNQAGIQASKRTNERSRPVEQPAGLTAMTWQRRIVHRRIYIPSWRRVAWRGTAWHGTVRRGSVPLGSPLGCARNRPRDLLHATRYSTDIGPILPAFFYPLLLLSTFLHFLRGLLVLCYHQFVSRNLTLSIVTSIDAFSEAHSLCFRVPPRSVVQLHRPDGT